MTTPSMDESPLTLFPELVPPPASHRTGVLPSQAIRELVKAGYVTAETTIGEAQIQPASLDLRLGSRAHRVQASFLPNTRTPVAERLRELTLHSLDISTPAVLERSCIYIVPLQEELRLPPQHAAVANPKSSTGRIDVFTRLITEYGTDFDSVPDGYHGKLYLEIVPRTFSIAVSSGCRLAQLRFARGAAARRISDTYLTALHAADSLLYRDDDQPAQPRIADGLWISVNLRADDPANVIGYRARLNAPVIDVERAGAYDPAEFWERLAGDERARLILNPGDFYILASKERIMVPPTLAAEMVGYDPSVGEFRVHYAGFFDPGFGDTGPDPRGTRAVLEVRSHDVPFLLEDGQRVGRLIYERLTDRPDKLYGSQIGSSYQRQGLTLSKHFRAP